MDDSRCGNAFSGFWCWFWISYAIAREWVGLMNRTMEKKWFSQNVYLSTQHACVSSSSQNILFFIWLFCIRQYQTDGWIDARHELRCWYAIRSALSLSLALHLMMNLKRCLAVEREDAENMIEYRISFVTPLIDSLQETWLNRFFIADTECVESGNADSCKFAKRN